MEIVKNKSHGAHGFYNINAEWLILRFGRY